MSVREAAAERVEQAGAPLLDETAALALTAAKGDLAATSELLRRLAPRVASVARAVLGGQHPDLDDAIQQSLIAFVQALPAFRGECPPAGYAARITVRVAVALRKRGREREARAESYGDTLPVTVLAPSPAEITADDRRKTILRDLLDEIPEEQAEALALRVVLGWSLDEVARATGAPSNTVRSRVRLAKEALRRRIERDPSLADELGVVR